MTNVKLILSTLESVYREIENKNEYLAKEISMVTKAISMVEYKDNLKIIVATLDRIAATLDKFGKHNLATQVDTVAKTIIE